MHEYSNLGIKNRKWQNVICDFQLTIIKLFSDFTVYTLSKNIVLKCDYEYDDSMFDDVTVISIQILHTSNIMLQNTREYYTCDINQTLEVTSEMCVKY